MTVDAGRIILHVDMDSFYASVEVLKRPELAGMPVIIGADPKQGKGRGVVSTCSYKAREYGVRSAMPISRAYILCPHAVFLSPDFPAYTKASERIMAILRGPKFPFEQVSIDEAFLDVTSAGGFGAAEDLARDLKKKIRTGLMLTCSIGIGPSKTVAKIASGFQKPDGLTIVPPERVKSFLGPLPVRKIPGIGKKSEEELQELGIRTIKDLASAGPEVLMARFGKGGIWLHDRALGIDGSGVVERGGPRSVSRETTFDEDTADPDLLAATMNDLVRDVHHNITVEGLRFRTVTAKVRYTGFITKTKARSVSHYTDDIRTIGNFAHALLGDLFSGRKIRLVGLRLSGFEERDAGQMTLEV